MKLLIQNHEERNLEDMNDLYRNEVDYAGFKCRIPDLVDIHWGKDEPETIVSTAKGWNDEIRADVRKAMYELLEAGEATFPLDSDVTWALRLAAMNADGVFNPYAGHGVCADNGCGWDNLYTILSEDLLKDASEHPERWVLATAYAI